MFIIKNHLGVETTDKSQILWSYLATCQGDLDRHKKAVEPFRNQYALSTKIGNAIKILSDQETHSVIAVQGKILIDDSGKKMAEVAKWYDEFIKFFDGLIREEAAEIDFWKKANTAFRTWQSGSVTHAYNAGVEYLKCLVYSNFKDEGFQDRVRDVLEVFDRVTAKRQENGCFQWDEQKGIQRFEVPSLDVLCKPNPVLGMPIIQRMRDAVQGRRSEILSKIEDGMMRSKTIVSPDRGPSIVALPPGGLRTDTSLEELRDMLYPK